MVTRAFTVRKILVFEIDSAENEEEAMDRCDHLSDADVDKIEWECNER